MPPKSKKQKNVEALKHTGSWRVNIPAAEYQSVMEDEEKHPIRVAFERRDPDLDPQLVWRGKDVMDWSDLVVQAPPLYIQEQVKPQAIIDDLMRRSEKHAKGVPGDQFGMFADFDGVTEPGKITGFYQHEARWTNRMILGDSLQVMASLAEREGLRGKVQCIYIDPPYGIKFNSNFQWSTTSRDVKDGKADHITREPEQVKAFRDTWRDGIHSYLTYLRDRLSVARDLLADSGSCFVQIGDENVHRVRALMDEVFGEDNYLTEIKIQKTGSSTGKHIQNIFDTVLWFFKNHDSGKSRSLKAKTGMGDLSSDITPWLCVEGDFHHRKLTKAELSSSYNRKGLTVFQPGPINSQHPSDTRSVPLVFKGEEFTPPKGRQWTYDPTIEMKRLEKANYLIKYGKTLRVRMYRSDDDYVSLSNLWTDTQLGGFSAERTYVVQTSEKVIQRCVLMSTDPGDLVLDPTCGSGTTAYVAEQWGRRWITIDTSRVALALARARIMGARYPYYFLADSQAGQEKIADLKRIDPPDAPTGGDIRQGFVYERVPHITLKAIANNAEIDEIWEKSQETLEPLREELNKTLGENWEEWEIPREAGDKWPAKAKTFHKQWWDARIKRQKEIDASIAAKADSEYLYDKPYEDKSIVRVGGPFTVESLSPHRVLAVDENDDLIDPDAKPAPDRDADEADFAAVILEHLKTTGVQQAHKEDKIVFSSITGWPGEYICAEGRYVEGDSETERRAGVFIGPEFGTVSRPDLVAAAREAGDAGFDVLIACAFNYDAHSADFDKLGRIPVLKAHMNADLHMADDLKNTGTGNLFVIFGEPDIEVVSGLWLVDSKGRMVAHYDSVAELSGAGSLEEINRLGCRGLSGLKGVSKGGKVRADQSGEKSGGVGAGKHRRGGGPDGDRGISPKPERGQRVSGGGGDFSVDRLPAEASVGDGVQRFDARSWGNRSDAHRAKTITALQALRPEDFPLQITTSHYAQVTIHGVDVFHPNSGEVRSSGPDGIACWFIDTDYNEESFFVRHAYFLGASDPYKSLKTTLKAEIDKDAWETLYSDTSRPFDKPKSGRIAVKVINHLGDEVMKVFGVN